MPGQRLARKLPKSERLAALDLHRYLEEQKALVRELMLLGSELCRCAEEIRAAIHLAADRKRTPVIANIDS